MSVEELTKFTNQFNLIHINSKFIRKCRAGDESEAKSMVERDPRLTNKQDSDGATGLMATLLCKHHSLCRWLLSLPGLDTNLRDEDNFTALHYACQWGAALDIVITLATLSSWETVNGKDKWGGTALDWAARCNNPSAALYLSWLGAECREENRKYSEVTLETWIEAARFYPGLKQDSQCWAMAANDVRWIHKSS